MALTLELPIELETALRRRAAERGLTVEDYAVEFLTKVVNSEATPKSGDLDEVLTLGARLTQNTPPLRDDAVARSYEEKP